MLDHREWLRINDIILLIHSMDDFTTMRQYFLDAIQLLVPHTKSTFYLLEDHKSDLILIDPVSINCDANFLRSYEKTFESAQYGKVAINARKSIVYRDTDLMSESVRVSTEAYESFLCPHNIPFGGGIIIANSGNVLGEVTFFRSQEQGDFSDKELYILNVLMEHLVNRFLLERKAVDRSSVEEITSKLMALQLTSREITITKLVVEGYNNENISARLCITVNTIKKHLQNIFTKLEVNSRTQLLHYISKL
jgi:DNA-binding CsgD family transcriptional regulator